MSDDIESIDYVRRCIGDVHEAISVEAMPLRIMRHTLWSFPCERMDAAHLIGLVEQTAAQGRWAILTFHGIHQGHLAVAEGDLEELCAYLARHRQRIWAAPLAEIAGYIAVHQKQGATARY